MSAHSRADKTQVIRSDWYRSLARYEQPDHRKAIWQLLDTFVPYAVLWVLMVYLVRKGFSYWLILPPMLLASGLLVRIFIFFHDCCHGCFFASRRANRILGYIAGILVFTPFEQWRHQHAGHHATSADLDRRGMGDIWTLTVDEYLAAPRRTQIAYRLFRSPFFLFLLGPPLLFLISHRFPHKGDSKRERASVLITDLAILALIGVASLTIGLRAYLLIQIPTMSIAGAIGVWLFYVQHQFEGDYWARHQEWDPMRAALEGSSYYKLPRILQWFSGNIGLHHIHHLRPRIPNYNLQQCQDDVLELQAAPPLTLRRSLKSVCLHLWDDAAQKLVSFRSIKRRRQRTEPQG